MYMLYDILPRMEITLSELRAKIFKIFDELIQSGKPLLIKRKGVLIRISAQGRTSRLARMKKRPGLLVKPEELIACEWEKEWKGDLP